MDGTMERKGFCQKWKPRDKKAHDSWGESKLTNWSSKRIEWALKDAGHNPLCHFRECRFYPEDDKEPLKGSEQWGTPRSFWWVGKREWRKAGGQTGQTNCGDSEKISSWQRGGGREEWIGRAEKTFRAAKLFCRILDICHTFVQTYRMYNTMDFEDHGSL